MVQTNMLRLFILIILGLLNIIIILLSPKQTKQQIPLDLHKSWWRVPGGKCHEFLNDSINFTSPSNHSLQLNQEMDGFAQRQLTYEVNDVDRDPNNETCESYLTRRHFVRESFSEEERQFPIAFSILVFKAYPQVENLVRTLHRPEHSICIHVDKTADWRFVRSLHNLVSCFPSEQLFIANTSVDVRWGTFTTLQADLVCMEELWKLWHRRHWKYFINLTGQEFPLRTNLELVRILKALRGANAMEARRNASTNRWPKTKPPFPLIWVKGAVHIVASWRFVNFSLHDPKAMLIQDLLKNEGSVQDELYFSTLNHNPHLGTPGAPLDPMVQTNEQTYPYFNRVKEWFPFKDKNTCHSGLVTRSVCIFGLADVPQLLTRRELFVNKFYWDFQHLALKCIQEWYWERTREEVIKSPNHPVRADISWFAELYIARHHQ